MKNIAIVLCLLISSLAGLTAQITITNATFPVAGDSLKTITDQTPDGIVMTPPGGNQVWDYTSLTPSSRNTVKFQPANEGSGAADFPGAELVVIADVGAETYFNVTANEFSIIGITGAGATVGLPIQADLVYNPALVVNKAPLNFFDIDSYTSNATIALPTSAIPGAIFDSLGVPTGAFDSIRLRITVQSLRVVDGFGTLAIPGGTYDVLRQKQTDYTTTGVDIHTFFGWIDIGTILSGNTLFPPDTTVVFNFLNNVAKEPIAVVTVDSTLLNAVQVEYKDNGVQNAVNPVTGEITSVLVSPNPAVDFVTFELKNMLPDTYTLGLFDINGKSVLTKELSSNTETISIQPLSGGLYFYHVLDSKGKVVANGKLIKN